MIAGRFAAHEREHSAALMTMILGLALEVRRHAELKDVENLMPGFEALGRREMLAALAELETAAIAGQQALARQPRRLADRRDGDGRRRPARRRPARPAR